MGAEGAFLRLLCVFAVAAIPLFGCSRSSLLLLADPAWYAASAGSVVRSLEGLCARKGLALRTSVLAEGQSAAGALTKRGTRAVLLSPFLAEQASSLASAAPDVLVLLPVRSPPADRPANLILLCYDPKYAFAAAGDLAAGTPGAWPLAIVAAEASAESLAFRSAAAAHGRLGDLKERMVPRTANPLDVRRMAGELAAQGTHTFMVALGALTPDFLDGLVDTDATAIVEGEGAGAAYPRVVWAAIEPDWEAGVQAALDGSSDASGCIELPGRLVIVRDIACAAALGALGQQASTAKGKTFDKGRGRKYTSFP